MNAANIYQEAIGGIKSGEENISTEKEQQDLMEKIERNKWLAHPNTQKLLSELMNFALVSSQKSSNLAENSNPADDRKVSNLLVEQSTLRKVINYARTGNYTNPV